MSGGKAQQEMSDSGRGPLDSGHGLLHDQPQDPDREAGADFFDRLPPKDTAQRLIKRLDRLGYHVTLQNLPPNAMP